ncbi:sensor histidine kinase [Psychroserpens sp. MEBiC05023]
MNKGVYIQTILRILFLIANTYALFYVFERGFTISLIVFGILFCFQILMFLDYIKGLFHDVEKSIDCLLYDDYSVSIPTYKRNNSLYDKTALLIEKHKMRAFEQSSEQLIFTNIIESLTIGILILRRDKQQHIDVFQINEAFTSFLNIPKYYNWNLLKEKITPLVNLIENWQSSRHTVSINVNDKTEDFFLKTSATQTNELQYLIISLETIQQLIDKKEKEAWYKLMNVMSHEIINTITPISSLAENLESLLQEDTPDEVTLNELSHGLGIIKKRSHHLNSFVDTYRKLTELPLPNKTEINLTDLVNNTLSLFEKEFNTKQISIHITAKKDYLINADKQQVEQIIINLISNCLYALVDSKDPKIEIHIFEENKKIILSVSDNGIGISEDIKDNIFIPYFTTRKNGSGIGLTLSKSIMEAHNGKIFFNSENNKTNFILSFIK